MEKFYYQDDERMKQREVNIEMKVRKIRRIRTGRKGVVRMVGLLLLLTALLAFYGFKIEPNLVTVRHYNIQASATGAGSLRIAQISDVQIGEHYTVKNLERVVRKIQKQQPDVILFSGDLFENYSQCGAEVEAEVTALLQRLDAPKGKYAVWGNRDYGGGAARAYQRILKAADFTLLRNSSAELTTDAGHNILLCGLDDSLFGKPDGSSFQQQKGNYDYRILALHEPDIAQLWSHSNFQLILAGHSHGGQVRLPFLPGMKTVLAEQYTRHFYMLNEETGLQLYVNTGLGTSHLPIRLGVIPEIAIFTVRF